MKITPQQENRIRKSSQRVWAIVFVIIIIAMTLITNWKK